ncbi:MAG TPA: nicotinamide riboside transporter PnuC [Flavobacteriaceae bacterium]|nr:nicotinamide riboside transporter PnuC [Flavobacteriaceae bacterium]
MTEVFNWLFSQYENIPTHLIVLELVAVLFGLLSPWFSMKNNILVYPTGIISTLIYVYILAVYGLLGDMLINAYYFAMSIYGWYIWTRKIDPEHYTPITTTTGKEKKQSLGIFMAAGIFVFLIYQIFDKWTSWTAYVDTLTTALFFVGMWLMAKKKLENWLIWILADLISVPLYFYKGLFFSSVLFLIMTIIAIFGYYAWKKPSNNRLQTV